MTKVIFCPLFSGNTTEGARYGKSRSLPLAALTVAVTLFTVIAYVTVSGVTKADLGPGHSAALAQELCGPNELCIWSGPNFTGERRFGDPQAPGTPTCGPLTIPTRSAINNTGIDLVFRDTECGQPGESLIINAGGQNPDFPFVAISLFTCLSC
ncbi:MAG: peptidase inhibitor family I36 protein [Egibacteraceae bacterium]